MEELLELFDGMRHELSIFMNGVCDFIGQHPGLTKPDQEIVHSCKKRLKDRSHLADKIKRRMAENREINKDNFFSEFTDLAGVRILHLFQEQFRPIDAVIRDRIQGGDWVLGERARAYTWDPESVQFFQQFDVDVIEKSTSYTSVHYIVKPRRDSPVCCEVQVRTLFEEIWGEVDHRMNYPTPSQNLACKEQIRVLAKLVGAGSRLLDSLHRVHITE
jgi:ppGpp synthetase/RelA/SpoT-type nucleotidyltranferase